jgi:hypothetical protein
MRAITTRILAYLTRDFGTQKKTGLSCDEITLIIMRNSHLHNAFENCMGQLHHLT